VPLHRARWLVPAALAAAACTGSARPARTLTVLLPSAVVSLDPNREVESVTESVLFNVYEPLVGFDEGLGIRTMLAESWEHPSPEQWRFRLRRGVRFHDGTPLTAGLVRDALLALKGDTGREASKYLSQVAQIVAADERTLDLVTHEPRAILASLPVVYVTKPREGGGFPELVGTGPYRLAAGEPGGRVALEPAGAYWGPRPEFGHVAFESVVDVDERIGRLEAGTADIAYDAPPELAGQATGGVRFVRQPGLSLFYIGLDLGPAGPPALRDVRVRQALHLAIDRARLVESFLHGAGQVATQPIPPAVFGYNPGIATPRFDPDQSRALLRQVTKAPLRLRLDVSKERLEAARLIQEDLAAVGVSVEPNPLARNEVHQRAKAGGSEAFLVGWSFSSGEASEFYEFCLHTPSDRFGFTNYGRFSNPSIDSIAETNAAVLNPAARRRLLQQAAELAMQELPVLPLFVADDVFGVRQGIRMRARADGEIWLPNVTSEGR
jgi:peptide/nickel transport system substrate-binding protein